MFISGKSIRFGYKNQVLASNDGHPDKFEAYAGACDTKDNSKPLGLQVVSALLSIVENPASHCVYFDNFFTYYYLLQDLHKNCTYRDADNDCVEAPCHRGNFPAFRFS